jgi:hypothetical protein
MENLAHKKPRIFSKGRENHEVFRSTSPDFGAF